jgi:hypothetical protein
MPSSFGIMTSSRTRSGESARALECLVTVGRCNHLVSLRAQPNAQHFYIRGIVIDHQFPRRSSQGRHSQIVLGILDDPPRRQIDDTAERKTASEQT